MYRLVENVNIGIFSDTINVKNVLLCLRVLHIELYLLITLSVTLILFQGHNSAKQFQLKILCSYPIKLKLYIIVRYIKQLMNIPLFLTFTHIQRR